MIGYVTLGSGDLQRAERFYGSFLPQLGYRLERTPEGLSCTLTTANQDGRCDLYVVPPFDRRAATAGNGTMVAFKMPAQSMVRDLYAAALAGGGTSDGEPGFRAAYGPHFYVGYLRDPQGNKIALFCNNRAEPRRPD